MHRGRLSAAGVTRLPDQTRRLVNALAEPSGRAETAAVLARQLGAEDLLILVADHELGVLRPAPGFHQTLPGGAGWRELLMHCAVAANAGKEIRGEVAWPDRERQTRFRAIAGPGAALVLLGGSSGVDATELEHLGLPLLFALLRAECAAAASAGLAAAAGDATARGARLTAALDATRAELATTVAEPEMRVAERTAALAHEAEERRKAEALMQAQKMEALGQLAGGVAHDFNNLLTVIMGGLEIVRRTAPEDNAQLRRAADTAVQGAQRAVTLTQRLLAFCRRQPLDPRPTDINRLICDMTDLLHGSLGETIELEGMLAARLWTVEVDAGQLESALLNLAVNARDAMPDGGTLTIGTENSELDSADAATLSEVQPGDYVGITVSDTGTGMSKATLERVFEPFFTTKQAGRGTGLGLSQVYGFARQSGGCVRIDSEPGRGTTVRLYLPRPRGAPPADNAEPVPRRRRDGPGGGRRRIARASCTETLCALGYRVLEAADASGALRTSPARSGSIWCSPTWRCLAVKAGDSLPRRSKRRRPGTKVLFTTGFARTAMPHHGSPNKDVALLVKPFTIEELAAAVREVLDVPDDVPIP